MKRLALAAALLACATTPFAQQKADVPQADCGQKPEYPGRLAMQSDNRRKGFENDINKYKDCIMKYVDARNAAAKANTEAANAAIKEYNDAMHKIEDDQKAANR